MSCDGTNPSSAGITGFHFRQKARRPLTDETPPLTPAAAGMREEVPALG